MYSLIFCYDKRNWEEPSYLKFLKALQEYTGNIFSYLVSVNIVNICLGVGGGGRGCGRGWESTPGKVPPAQPSCMLSFLCNDKRDWEEPGHLKFLNVPLEDTANKLAYEHSQWGRGEGGGTIYPGEKCSPPLNPHVCFHFYVMIKGIEKSLCWGGGDTLPRGILSPTPSPTTTGKYWLCLQGRDRRNCFQYPLEGLSETTNNQALLIPFIIT